MLVNYKYHPGAIGQRGARPASAPRSYPHAATTFPVQAQVRPSLDTHDEDDPAERQAGERNGKVQESHHVVVPRAHGGPRDFLTGEDEDDTARGVAERSKKLGGWTAGEGRVDRRAKVEEEVGEESEGRAASEEDTPQRVDFDLEHVVLVVGRHGESSLDTQHSWADSSEGRLTTAMTMAGKGLKENA